MSDISLDRPSIVLRRPKGSELYFLLAGVGAVLIGIGMSFVPLMLFEAIALGVVGGIVRSSFRPRFFHVSLNAKEASPQRSS